MSRKSKYSLQKRLREIRKAERAARKREKREERRGHRLEDNGLESTQPTDETALNSQEELELDGTILPETS